MRSSQTCVPGPTTTMSKGRNSHIDPSGFTSWSSAADRYVAALVSQRQRARSLLGAAGAQHDNEKGDRQCADLRLLEKPFQDVTGWFAT